MTALEQHSLRSRIDMLSSYAKEKLDSTKAALFIKFIHLYFSQAYIEDFEDQSLQNLYGIAFSHWNLMKSRRPKELKVAVLNPSKETCDWESPHTVIEVVVEDSPFLVDSMQMELNRLGLTIHLMIYMGGMKVERDELGHLIDVLPYNSMEKELVIESPIYMEVSCQADPDVLLDIRHNLERILKDVRVAVEDWGSMQERLRDTIQIISNTKTKQDPSEVNESKAFLRWMLEDNFTFLGARDYEKIGEGADEAMRLIPNTGLGVLRDESRSKVVRKYCELPKAARKIALSRDQILIISKTNTRSTVHRPDYTDYIGIKLFDENGNIIKERRFIGLYTSTAYNADPKTIPLIRKKVNSIFQRSGLPIRSHSGKDLMHILATFPRDDLFQGTVDDLYRIALGILHLQERPKLRLFIREDCYRRYISCFVYLPKENFNTDVNNRMIVFLKQTFNGTEVSFNTYFSASILARVHFVVRLDTKRKLQYDPDKIEKELSLIARSWHDDFHETLKRAFGEKKGEVIYTKYRHAFQAGYREAFSPENALKDIKFIERLTEKNPLAMSFYRPPGVTAEVIKFKLFHREHTVPLSDALPILENMGLRVVGEQPYRIQFPDGSQVWINDFSMTYSKDPTFEVEEVKIIFQQAFNKIWSGQSENDIFNRLVLEAQLNWREISVLRAYAKYLKQTGFTYSPEYIAETLVNHSSITQLIRDLFVFRFNPDPKCSEERDVKLSQTKTLIETMLDEVSILDEDRILRRYMDLIYATLRTNYYLLGHSKKPKSYLSFKFDSSLVPELPLPLPKYEIFVYSPRFEGVHLRADKVARGGIRWSDRREDFRTEVLGLMKAQRVKNAVIVPAGAKGGFIPKCLSPDVSREETLQEGIECYCNFIRGLLDLTDNIKETLTVPPENVVCYDQPDTYLVVAADKGTATFSDIANSISLERNYWLGDAFASGGSTGYDHKKMGITARGAWVSAERHFQEIGINIDEAEITVVGIGDMSGDVFGNGMLLSRHLKLVAAFNHLHIFLDPDPNPEASFKERERLFNLQRSTWLDYDPDVISKGGGVFKRTAKSIFLTPEVRTLLGVDKDRMVPNELISAILKAPVDMIWNGGIGTYVKSSMESNDSVGDRSNDAVRVDGKEVRARVVCEGGNLGLTQLGRIEYELNGGKVNTDFIDNSAGVDCSDHEVNIKILLNHAVLTNEISLNKRNELLAQMTDEVSELVLQDNYHQNRAISLESFESPLKTNLYIRYLDFQEQQGKIERNIEFLPDGKTLLERKVAGFGLTRPEISVLFSYSKIILKEEIRSSDLLEDDYFSQYINKAFPEALGQQYAHLLGQHYLHKEIVLTQLSNRLISNMGFTFVYQMKDEAAVSTSDIIKAYMIAHKIYHMEDLYVDIDSLDYKVDATVQMQMASEVIRLVRRATRWFLHNPRGIVNIQEKIDAFSRHIFDLSKRLPNLILGDDKAFLEEKRDALIAANVTPELAIKIASSTPMYHALNIIEVANTESVDVYYVAKIYFILVDRLRLFWFRDQINEFPADSRWMFLLKAGYKSDLDTIQRALTVGVINVKTKSQCIADRIETWLEEYKPFIDRWQHILSEMRSSTSKDFQVFSVAIRELSKLAQENNIKK